MQNFISFGEFFLEPSTNELTKKLKKLCTIDIINIKKSKKLFIGIYIPMNKKYLIDIYL